MTKKITAYLKHDGWKCLITGAAIVGLAVAGNAYISAGTQAEALEHSHALVDRLLEMEKLDEAIGQMAAGEANEARRILEVRLANVTALVRDQMESVDDSTRALAVLACLRSAQSEQAHPASHRISSRSTGSVIQPAADTAQ